MDHALSTKQSPYSSKHFLPQVWQAFRDGDIWVKLSALICGSSCFARKQYVKGFLITLLEAVLVWAIPGVFLPYMSKLNTLGTVQAQRTFNPETMKNEWNDYDNSFMILLFGLIGIIILFTAVVLWLRNIRNARDVEYAAKSG